MVSSHPSSHQGDWLSPYTTTVYVVGREVSEVGTEYTAAAGGGVVVHWCIVYHVVYR